MLLPEKGTVAYDSKRMLHILSFKNLAKKMQALDANKQ